MATQALKARGTKLRVETAEGSGTYQDIPECKDINGPTTEAEEITVTSQDSPSNRKEFLSGDVDDGEMTAEINLVLGNTVHQQLRSDLAAGTPRNYRKEYPSSGGYLGFRAYVKSLPETSPVSGAQTTTLTLRITGAVDDQSQAPS